MDCDRSRSVCTAYRVRLIARFVRSIVRIKSIERIHTVTLCIAMHARWLNVQLCDWRCDLSHALHSSLSATQSQPFCAFAICACCLSTRRDSLVGLFSGLAMKRLRSLATRSSRANFASDPPKTSIQHRHRTNLSIATARTQLAERVFAFHHLTNK